MKNRSQNGGLRGHYVALFKWCNNFRRDRRKKTAQGLPQKEDNLLHGLDCRAYGPYQNYCTT